MKAHHSFSLNPLPLIHWFADDGSVFSLPGNSNWQTRCMCGMQYLPLALTFLWSTPSFLPCFVFRKFAICVSLGLFSFPLFFIFITRCLLKIMIVVHSSSLCLSLSHFTLSVYLAFSITHLLARPVPPSYSCHTNNHLHIFIYLFLFFLDSLHHSSEFILHGMSSIVDALPRGCTSRCSACTCPTLPWPQGRWKKSTWLEHYIYIYVCVRLWKNL